VIRNVAVGLVQKTGTICFGEKTKKWLVKGDIMTKCTKHPRYKGIRPPKYGCKVCIGVYYDAKGLASVLRVAGYMANILYNIKQTTGAIDLSWREVARIQQNKFDDALRDFKSQL
jgi:hypothetical protein